MERGIEHHEDLVDRDRRHINALFRNPDLAASVLRSATLNRDSPGQITGILLDNATVDHAMRYFRDSPTPRTGPREQLSRPPTRPRLMLLAAAEFVNAAVLYESGLTGPERTSDSYNDPLLREAAQVVRTVSNRLSWEEISAVLALAKATALESAREQGTIGTVSTLLRNPLSEESVLRQLNRINQRVADVSPHHLPWLVEEGDSLHRVSAVRALTHSQIDLDAIDRTDDGPYEYKYDYPYSLRPSRHPQHSERFAAHLIYRTRVYMLLADLLGYPYGADALRSELVRPRPRRSFAERVTTLVDDAERVRDQQVNELLDYEAFRVRIPLVLKYVLGRASKPSEVLEITLETRDSKSARRFRAYCARVDTAIAEGKRDDVARACAELSSYGVRFETELAERQPAKEQTVQAAKELVSVGSPLLGALIPGLTLAAGGANRWRRGRRFAFIEQLTSTPRCLNEVEHEFARLWPHL